MVPLRWVGYGLSNPSRRFAGVRDPHGKPVSDIVGVIFSGLLRASPTKFPLGEATMDDEARHRVLSLKMTIWITRGSRFNASRRLEDRVHNIGHLHNVTAFTLVVTGVILTAATATGASPVLASMAGASIAILGVTQLAIQLSSDSCKALDLARSLHRDGQDMSPLLDQLADMLAFSEPDEDTLDLTRVIEAKYRQIESRTGGNQLPRDRNLFLAENRVPRDWAALDLDQLNQGRHEPKMFFLNAFRHRAGWHWRTLATWAATALVPASQLVLVYFLYLG